MRRGVIRAAQAALAAWMAAAALAQSGAAPGVGEGGAAQAPRWSGVSTAAGGPVVVERDTATVLAMRIPELELVDAPLSDVFEFLAQLSGTSIYVRWDRLEDLGIERNEPVRLSARNLRLEQVLWLLLNQRGLREARLAYRVEGAQIVVSTEEEFGKQLVLRVYDVTDLLLERIRRPRIDVGRTREVPTGNTVAVAAGAVAVQPVIERLDSGVFFESEDIQGGEVDPDVLVRQLIELIVATIEPDTWAANGGKGTIMAFQNRLVVRNSVFVHQQLGGALTEGP